MQHKKHTYIWRILLVALTLVLCLSCLGLSVAAEEQDTPAQNSFELNCKSAVLMEASTGKILYEQNPDEALPPASVTKIMTLLLVMEAIDEGKIALTDMVSASEYAAGMGGSQVYLKVGETMSVEDMLKSVVISSANDAAVALAEFVSGDVDTFVRKMNDRAKELGMKSTRFENVTGLDDTAQNHLTSAKDIALMSRALIAHPTILKYSSIWMDTIRGGAFGLTNTNRLVRFYRGATGLKTGSTSKAGFCVSVTAEREGLSLICVIMGAESRDVRNAQATKLLDWGFANYAAYRAPGEAAGDVRVLGGVKNSCSVGFEAFDAVVSKGDVGKIERKITLQESIAAPVKAGDEVGRVQYLLGNEVLGEVPITAREDIGKIGFFGLWQRLLAKILLI
ncbi:MAG: D-alanyl-D-alanine carboxypeptidase [Ruminococcaceae bacterium]|nr:D-alanyl-D-alanine carboxypeptidase [Oscillospiraceae bacterium]